MVVRRNYEPNRGNYGKRKIQYQELAKYYVGGQTKDDVSNIPFVLHIWPVMVVVI
jgi:hypothetical protein